MSEGQYVIVRSVNAGVFAGNLPDGETMADEKPRLSVRLLNARRLWYWDGAASLSELAVSGVSRPANCKFPVKVAEVIVNDVCEVLAVTEKARGVIAKVPVWKA